MAFTTLQELIDRLGDYGERAALIQVRQAEAKPLSYHGLAEQIAHMAGGLVRHGISPGERLAVMATMAPATVAICLAILRAGGVVVPIDVQSSDAVLKHILDDAQPRMVFADQMAAEQVQAIRPDLPLYRIGERGEESPEPGKAPLTADWQELMGEKSLPLPPIRPEDPATLFYTSGTTGMPKGVPLSHQNICVSLNAVLAIDFIRPGDQVLLPLPLHHVYPFVIGMMGPLALGVGIVFPEGLSGPQMVTALNVGGASVVLGVPRLYRALFEGIQERARQSLAGRILFPSLLAVSTFARQHLGLRLGCYLFRSVHRRMGGRLRLLASGGSALDRELAGKLLGLGWDLAAGYGLTETAPLIAFSPPALFSPEHVGPPIPAVELAIDGQDTDSGLSSRGSVGEIWVRGANLFAGYLHLPEETQRKFRNGWFRTGDLGYLDASGFLHIQGRRSTLIVTEGGENIQPDPVEAAYSQSPLIREIGVLADNGGLAAVIVPDPGEVQKQPLAETEAIHQAVAAVSKQLPSYQRLSAFQISHQPLSRTRLGDIRRHHLQTRYETLKTKGDEAASPSIREMGARDQALLKDERARQVWQWLKQRYPGHPLSPDSRFQTELGVDSLDWLGISQQVRALTSVALDESAISKLETVRDLLVRVAGEAPKEEGTAAAPDRLAPFERPDEVLSQGQKRWLKPLNRFQLGLAWILFQALRLMAKLLFGAEKQGKTDWPEDIPVVIAPNHTSYLDPFVLAAVLDWRLLRRTRWAGWSGAAFANPLTRFVSRLGQAFPVNSQAALASTLAFATQVLRQGENLIWFPEGQRSPHGELLPFKPGVGLLLRHTEAVCVPVHIRGTHQAMPVGTWRIRPRKVTIRFGDLVDAQTLESQGAGEAPSQRIAEALRSRVAALGEKTR